MSRTLASAFLLALMLAAALPGCGDAATSGASDSDKVATATSTHSGPLPKACELLDATQAQTVLGQPASLMGDDPENCVWASQGHPGSMAMLMVQISEESSADEAQSLFDAMVKAAGGMTDAVNAGIGAESTHLDSAPAGLGDRAWRRIGNVDAIGARQIVVRKGRRLLFLNVTGMRGDSEMDARLEQAARDVVAKL